VKRPDRVTRLLKLIGCFIQLETADFQHHDEETVAWLRISRYEAAQSLTDNDKFRIRGYALEAAQNAIEQQQLWDEIEAELAAAKSQAS